MIRLIELLREEHRGMEELLLVMEGELSIFDQQERPDYELLPQFGSLVACVSL